MAEIPYFVAAYQGLWLVSTKQLNIVKIDED